MKSEFTRPDWMPQVPDGMRILVTGATGGLGRAVVAMLADGSDCIVGAHGASQGFETTNDKVIPLKRTFETEEDCRTCVDEFAGKAGGIDALVVLSGSIRTPGHWKDMSDGEWQGEMNVNLNQPFYLARAAMAHMNDNGGRIVLTGTESALHGGSAVSFPYAVAKRGTECMVQGLAREGAPDNILVNGIRLGYIASGFHQRWHNKTDKDMAERANMVPLKRGGDPDEAAALIVYLLSGWAGFITGQMIPLTGGDWL
ncbi:MAG: SDR family oxidoreductase [Rhodospirillaceae bacterium]|nr:SDR family oxidoreductase [Rhodospirillaceae bacterium]MBT4219094.1 SDR family oxidoreductase [Rhodospirillaceae bacterium]MBT4463530.1 SDR family oxidoreductase [Rhodospirillaceae bacterium]MBT5014251.1 SDR family oxidoreductase [Rhodospirillaceae bacterium]MBT5309525.1 SDR family oxidoreductase [Rhodospirillaceae bacterium]